MPKTKKQANEAPTKRVRKLDYRSKKKSVKISEPIPSSWQILKLAVNHIWRNKKLFIGIMLVYAVLYLLFVKGLAGSFKLSETRQSLEASVDNQAGSLALGTALLGSLLGTAGSTSSAAAGVYQVLLFIVLSLALIWALRQTYETPKKLKTRQAFYQGMYPLVPYVIVWLVVFLQMLPALIGLTVFNIVSSNGIAVGILENLLWASLAFILVCVSIFMTSSSIFATYITALPNMAPMQAIRKAKKVVKFRRFAIIRKLIFLPLLLTLCLVVFFLPLVIYVTFLAEIVFIIFMLVAILLSQAYVYNLYRKLI